jgi:hypothetical protein
MSTQEDEFLKSLRATFKVEATCPTARETRAIGRIAGAPCSGHLADAEAADKHFATTLDLLGSSKPSDLLPQSDGLTAGRLTEKITSIIAMAATL